MNFVKFLIINQKKCHNKTHIELHVMIKENKENPFTYVVAWNDFVQVALEHF